MPIKYSEQRLMLSMVSKENRSVCNGQKVAYVSLIGLIISLHCHAFEKGSPTPVWKFCAHYNKHLESKNLTPF